MVYSTLVSASDVAKAQIRSFNRYRDIGVIMKM